MSYELLLTRTATVIHRVPTGTTDKYNAPAWTETTVTVPCYVEPIGADEDTVARDTVTEALRGFFMPDLALSAHDIVVIEGTRYEVVAAPARDFNARTGEAHHREALLAEES